MSEVSFYVHPTAIVDQPAEIGEGTKIWHFCHVMAHCQIGKGCSLGQNVFVASKVSVGNNVKIQNNVSLYEGVICEDDVFLGPSMVFTNVYNPRSAVNRKGEYLQTLVKQGATIGAGTVVVRDVPDYALMVGNPARQIGWMSEHGERLRFDSDNVAFCPGSGERYILEDNQVKKVLE